MVGQQLYDGARQDFTWWFTLADGSSITTDAFWRLVSPHGIEASTSDDGHTFGKHTSVNCIDRALEVTKGKKIVDVRVAEHTSDLVLTFESGIRLDFLTLSSGYESWRVQHRSHGVICMGGGQLWINSNEKQD